MTCGYRVSSTARSCPGCGEKHFRWVRCFFCEEKIARKVIDNSERQDVYKTRVKPYTAFINKNTASLLGGRSIFLRCFHKSCVQRQLAPKREQFRIQCHDCDAELSLDAKGLFKGRLVKAHCSECGAYNSRGLGRDKRSSGCAICGHTVHPEFQDVAIYGASANQECHQICGKKIGLQSSGRGCAVSLLCLSFPFAAAVATVLLPRAT